jgi:energy-coupling factor transporter ATP-binding protein EcfA2
VKEVIKRLGLAKVVHTKVGTSMNRGLSGGERKRLNVAQELLTDPPVLLADEPTSGLDSVAALSLVDVLAEIASGGRTVLATVHQPSSKLFARFTKVLLLAEGRVIYFGPASYVARYLASPPVFKPCPRHYNIADHMLEVAQAVDPAELAVAWDRCEKEESGMVKMEEDESSDDDLSVVSPKRVVSVTDEESVAVVVEEPKSAASGGDADEKASASNLIVGVDRLSDVSTSAEVRAAEKALDTLVPASREPPACVRGCGRDSRWPVTWMQQVFALTARALRTSAGASITWIQSTQHTLVCVIGAIIWWQLRVSAGSIQDRLGLLFFYGIYSAFQGMFSALLAFPAERSVLNRERRSGAYRVSAYYVAKCLADIPVACVYPALMSLIVYWCTGLRQDAGAFFAYLGTMLLISQVAQSLGVLISASVMDMSRAITVASVVMLGFMLVSQFYSTEIPPALAWIKYIGFPTYGYALLVFNEILPESSFPCVDGEGFGGFACPVSGADVRSTIGVPLDSGGCIGILVAMYMLYRFIGYVALRRNS